MNFLMLLSMMEQMETQERCGINEWVASGNGSSTFDNQGSSADKH